MKMPQRVCSTDKLYHYLFHPDPEVVASILENGLRSLSDFPDSPRVFYYVPQVVTYQPGGIRVEERDLDDLRQA